MGYIMNKKIFISFNEENIKVANGMSEYFGSDLCWLPHNDLVQIDDSLRSEEEQTLEAIKNAEYLVLILSKYSQYSKPNLDEVHYAFDNGTKVVTFRIEDVSPSKDMEPYLNKELWFDTFKGHMYEHMKRLEDIISS